MSRISVCLMVAFTGAFAASAQAETRAVSWQGQAIEASISEPTRGLGPSRDELLKMAREAVPVTPNRSLPNAGQTGK
jgi:hypothetical protein